MVTSVSNHTWAQATLTGTAVIRKSLDLYILATAHVEIGGTAQKVAYWS